MTATPTRVLMADIAAALGVRPELVRQWLSRGKLPVPSGRVGQSPWWEPGVIEPWIDRERATDRLRVAVRAAVADGMPEAVAARTAEVSRNTVRSWLGK